MLAEVVAFQIDKCRCVCVGAFAFLFVVLTTILWHGYLVGFASLEDWNVVTCKNVKWYELVSYNRQ